MRETTIAERYARALLDIGVERGNFEQLGRELDRVSALFKAEDLRELFRNPKFTSDDRKQVMAELLRRVMVSPVCRNFLFLLVDRDRIGLFVHVVEAYHRLSDRHAGRLRAQVTVPRRLSEPDAARLKTVLQKVTGQTVIIEQIEDPEIIGGVITRIDGKIYDGSVRAQLDALRAGLMTGA